MEAWRTYTPDGRMLEVEYEAGEWVAHCAGGRGSGGSALEAITAALGDRQPSIDGGKPSLDAWAAEHAERLEAEAG